MDPNEALEVLRRWARAFEKFHPDDDASAACAGWEMADAFEALDAWILKGGFLPDPWRLVPDGPRTLDEVRSGRDDG